MMPAISTRDERDGLVMDGDGLGILITHKVLRWSYGQGDGSYSLAQQRTCQE